MALGWFRYFAQGRAVGYSGGSEPGDSVNPAAVAAMAEVGIDIAHETPQRWSDAELDAADVVVTMGCGDTCPFVPGTRYEDWPLDDPAGQPLETVRRIRDEIRKRVEHLLGELGVDPA
jgi:protein-tyrosine-phosphatase